MEIFKFQKGIPIIMHRLGIINLGLNRFKEFKQGVSGIKGSGWQEDIYYSHYKKINPTEIAESCDALVLSPGSALVGILDHSRAEIEPQIGPLYNLIQDAILEGNVPILGVNAGYEAMMNSLGCSIDQVPDKEIDNYHTQRLIDTFNVKDPIVKGADLLTVNLTNNFRVMPMEGQRKRWGRRAIKHICISDNYALMSRVEAEAPVYGVQFNIEEGTKKVFSNFFELASMYLS
jgi:GMP synthase-like glutamine amidotransferase